MTAPTDRVETVVIDAGPYSLGGTLVVPAEAGAIVLFAAAERPSQVAAVVSRGGRPDLADEALGRVEAPTLLIVGGEDPQVLDLNRWAQRRLAGASELVVVAGASHLFEEPGALEEVARLAAGWFGRHLVAALSQASA